MSSIERWNRQEVENTDPHRQERDELNEQSRALLRGLAGHVGDPIGPPS
jgi:hypothetical protein